MSKKSILQCGAGLFVMAACIFSVNAAPPIPPRLEHILDQLPAAVQKTIRAQVAEGRLRAIDQDNEDGRLTYDVEMVRQGKVRGFTVGEDGNLVDTEVFLDELPAAVQQSIKKKVGDATLGEIDRSIDADGASYEVETIGGGTNRSFTVDASGKLTDEEVFLGELPQDFQANVRKELGAGTIDNITRSFDEDGTVYDVDVIENGKTGTLTFSATGVLASKSEEIALPAAPEATQKQIQTLSTGGKLVTVSKITEDGAVSYDVDIRQDGKVKSYTVADDGRVISSDAK